MKLLFWYDEKVITDIKNNHLAINPNTWKNFNEKLKHLISFVYFNRKKEEN